MASQPELETTAIHILPNISRSKDKQTMKHGQLRELNNRNFFCSKIIQKMRQGD